MIWHIAKWLRRFFMAGVAVGLLRLLDLFDPAWLANSNWLKTLHAVAPTVAGASVVFLSISNAVMSYVGEPWVRDAVHSILDAYEKACFRSNNGKSQVTLFRYRSLGSYWWYVPIYWVKFLWNGFWHRFGYTDDPPCDGWLQAVCRSGHLRQKLKTCFEAPDDPHRAQGVAGEIWVAKGTVYKGNLPVVTPKTTGANLSAYAEASNVGEAWIKKWQTKGKPQLPTEICGFPIESKKSKNGVWGVLVLDGMAPNSLDQTKVEATQQITAAILRNMVDRL